jgi:hypothetical protein
MNDFHILMMKDFLPSCNEVAVGLCFGEKRAGGRMLAYLR